MENIIENNKLIAEFMDMLPDGNEIPNPLMIPAVTGVNTSMIIDDYIDDGLDIFEAYRFNDSWDWLMPVVDKIELLGYNFNVESRQDVLWKQIKADSHVSIDTQKAKNIKEWSDLGNKNVHELFITHYFNSPSEKFEAIYKSVVEFIKWYNENKS